MLENKNILLGVTGGIAAYKIANLASMLKKQGANVKVIMTKNACQFITPMTFETLTSEKVYIDTFDRNFEFKVDHIELGKWADVFLIAPASANVIGKLANGIADDMLTTTTLAMRCPVVVSPAMNTTMFENKVVKHNIMKLRTYGMEIILPASGHLACGDIGAGKMPEPEMLLEYIKKALYQKKDLSGKKVCVSAGPTREAIDPVRYISNNSTGKMGIEIAKMAAYRGAKVSLVMGPSNVLVPDFIKRIDIKSAEDMYEEIMKISDAQDIIIKAAAVADYTPANYCDEKIKKKDGDLTIELSRTKDILKELGERKENNPKKQFICGFSMETENMEENSKSKLVKKNVDMIVANNVKIEGAGFGTDTNVVTIFTKDDEIRLDKLSKLEVAEKIFDEIVRNF
ncbi:bifunctional phosphopantothenoylcysteine decarboxylase/phosphopantothenate--cysteine ligase CoaBC [Lachnoanaerobaculum umeaense]|uniref:Coenzyme A biosynthesis bifunctional protein CoaBC n=1 Tax=Lachnoanaerobaculum umeaense TaxID=617123 RepID=A0A385Q0K6_9FIRM|nr:bifunctional phosphopantothenoylcysteine decarboxylase/phosphopantothenate--cysteine ligase CoaBC [Lachnoanaerobaculum umeaense]AYA99991.1 bifunctional phosphopantothenoylcysteine decarboxylase/phosphopantothenate--cysteine ligase CoaBC [Lachnoanaerobaculum umeaense]PZW94040.1 phosphopantothenoylcysteine decarboxylase/phosphopantothenate--cysteine ligase [Lachnoanaerobaculum umeaense]